MISQETRKAMMLPAATTRAMEIIKRLKSI